MTLPITDFRLLICAQLKNKSEISNWQSEMSFRLFMIRVLTATPAKFTKFQTIRCRLLIFCRDVVAALAIRALKYNVVAWHKSNLQLHSQISNLRSEFPSLQCFKNLFHHFRDCPRAYRAAAFANREAQTFLHRNRRDQLDVHLDV